MQVDCEGCAGCCIDWHSLAPDVSGPERSGPRQPLDDTQNFVPLDREEVRAFLEEGLGDVLAPRLWTVERAGDEDDGSEGSQSGGATHTPDGGATQTPAGRTAGRTEPAVPTGGTVEIDGHRLAAASGRPVFYVGLLKPQKPVAPFDREHATWLPTCVFLDPETLQCRVHGEDTYPDACAAYPGYNLLLDQSTECERVEAATGDERLLDDEPPTDPPGVGLGPQALGSKLFAHPEPETLQGRVERIARGEPTDEDRATFAAVAAASSPGTLSIAEERRETAFEQALAADSWAGRAIAAWEELAGGDADPGLGEHVEVERGAPTTPGWE